MFVCGKEAPTVPAARRKGDEDQSVTVDDVVESDTEDLVAHSATENAPEMSEEDSDERETRHKMWLSAKVTTLEKENQDLKGALQEMETRLAQQETASRQAEERCAKIETAVMQIAQFVQKQNTVIESSRALMSSIGEEVNSHRANFQKVG